MPTHIALLRGINVGGCNLLAMSDLKNLLETIGFTNARSLLQSGNLIFEGRKQTLEHLEKRLEAQTKKRFGIAPDYFVRNTEEWRHIIARNPYPENAKLGPSHLVVMFFKQPLDAKDVEACRQTIKGRETIQADGRHLYITYPDGIGASKFTNIFIEKKLGQRGTARNWNTILKVAALIQK